MVLTSKHKGFTLSELLVVSLMTAMVTLASIDMIAQCFQVEVSYNKYLKAKQTKNNISGRIINKIKETTKTYYNGTSLQIPISGTVVSVDAENETLAVLLPKFDSNGDIIQPNSNTTTFKAVAFSVIAKSVIDSNAENDTFVLVETSTEFDLTVTLDNPLYIQDSLPTDWSSGKSQVLADNLRPANFENLYHTLFDIEGDMVNFAFVPKDGYVYFPSSQGTESIDDSEYITRCQFENFRI